MRSPLTNSGQFAECTEHSKRHARHALNFKMWLNNTFSWWPPDTARGICWQRQNTQIQMCVCKSVPMTSNFVGRWEEISDDNTVPGKWEKMFPWERAFQTTLKTRWDEQLVFDARDLWIPRPVIVSNCERYRHAEVKYTGPAPLMRSKVTFHVQFYAQKLASIFFADSVQLSYESSLWMWQLVS